MPLASPGPSRTPAPDRLPCDPCVTPSTRTWSSSWADAPPSSRRPLGSGSPSLQTSVPWIEPANRPTSRPRPCPSRPTPRRCAWSTTGRWASGCNRAGTSKRVTPRWPVDRSCARGTPRHTCSSGTPTVPARTGPDARPLSTTGPEAGPGGAAVHSRPAECAGHDTAGVHAAVMTPAPPSPAHPDDPVPPPATIPCGTGPGGSPDLTDLPVPDLPSVGISLQVYAEATDSRLAALVCRACSRRRDDTEK